MKQLSINETAQVSGGMGPLPLDGMAEAFMLIFGIGAVGAFVIGAATVYGIQYFRS